MWLVVVRVVRFSLTRMQALFEKDERLIFKRFEKNLFTK